LITIDKKSAYTNHIKYLISSEPHRHLNPRRIDAEMVIPF